MSIVIPAVLPSSRADLEEKLARYRGVASIVQVDVVDGKFASPATWPYTEGDSGIVGIVAAGGTLPYLGHFRYEIDLMVADPQVSLGSWIDAGASRLVIHAESTPDLATLIGSFAKTYGHDKDFAPDLLAIGLAINVGSDLALIEPYLDRIDYVQFMGIDQIGKQGQPFSEAVLPKIRAFRKKHPQVDIQVDGGVSLTTAPLLLQAGVGQLVIGSQLLHAKDPAAEIARYDALAEIHGIYA